MTTTRVQRALLHRLTPILVMSVMIISLVGLVRAHPAGAAQGTVTATGRFVYIDDNGNTVGIRFAPIEMCDVDGLACSVMATGTTREDGTFTLIGAESDSGTDLPDPRVKVVADASSFSGTIRNPGKGGAIYCFESPEVSDANGPVGFGQISPASGTTCDIFHASTKAENGAWQLWNDVRQAWEFMEGFTLADPLRNMPAVDVLWPAANSEYDGQIHIDAASTFEEPVIMHEYGHHVMANFADSPAPDFVNGNCDKGPSFGDGGHCMWWSELDAIAWTEGWPDYLAEVLTTTLGRDDTASSRWGVDPVTKASGSIESPPHPHPDSDFPHVEGYVAAILWDLQDALADDHDSSGSVDRLAESFATQWSVLVNFDPDPFDKSHDHPVTLNEFWDGLASARPDLANRLSEIYDENHVTGRQAANLKSSGASVSSLSVFRGETLTVTDTTTNAGNVSADPSATSSFLSKDTILDIGDTVLGQRAVGRLQPAGDKSTGSTVVTVPATLAPGHYWLFACADGPGIIWEDHQDSDNCAPSSPQIDVLARPDLRQDMVTNPPPVRSAGESFTVVDANRNIGDGAADKSVVRFWLFPYGAEPTPPSVLLIGERKVKPLAPHASSVGETTLTIPTTTKAAVYSLVACSDDTHVLVEDSESNNCLVAAQQITVLNPDLAVVGVSSPPATATPGAGFSVQDLTQNFGPGTAAPSETQYFLSSDVIRDPSDIRMDGFRPIGVLPAGANSTGTVTATVPSAVTPGDYVVLACADAPEQLAEVDELNNCTASTTRVHIT